ncbi:serine O-acetyltransferase [Tepidamorphus gemmatus]|uniref:Serine acetyltransferase n=1 Tax=Tepidamorphus gemmatus TaxID=747076 RepID=A0A4R3MHH4_9HYPH|nr:serine O-acetyltransferase [Tepidamorphus gemmatus]TCT12648.1 serine O-acetyltransferase [Tepidamorphus gemmatus]
MVIESQRVGPLGRIATCDPVWARIREEADEIVVTEPALAGFVLESVLNHDTLEDAVASRVASRLAHEALGSQSILHAFREAVAAQPEIGEAFRADIVAVYERDPACSRYIEPLLYFKGFHALEAHRLSHWLWNTGRRDFALYLQSRVSAVFSVDINPAARIGRGIFIDHGHAIVVGQTAVIEDEVSILHGVTLGGTGKETGDRHPKVRRGVLIGAGAKILGNIEVGACSRVAAGSVVLRDVPPNTTVAGVPAKVVGKAGCAEPALSMDQMIDGRDATG